MEKGATEMVAQLVHAAEIADDLVAETGLNLRP
jgi:hypothetical protein